MLPEANNRSSTINVTIGQKNASYAFHVTDELTCLVSKEATSFYDVIFEGIQPTACLALLVSTLLKGIFFFF